MIGKLTLAGLIAGLTLSAAHAEGVRVSLVGKSPSQIDADIKAAAQAVCREAMRYETFPLDAYQRCVRGSVAEAYRKIEVAQAALARQSKVARR